MSSPVSQPATPAAAAAPTPPRTGWAIRLLPALRRRRRLLIVLALLGCAALLAGVYLWPWYNWFAAQRALGRYHGTEARNHLAVCLRRWPSSPRVHLLAARAARLAGDYAEAEEQLGSCQRLQQAPSDEHTLEVAMLSAAEGDLNATVVEYLQTRAQRDPAAAPLILEALAEGYIRMCRILEAMTCLDVWLKQQPDTAQALFLRGNAMRQAGALQKAVPDYRRVAELEPDNREARWWLALGLQEIGRYDEALTHLEYLRKRQPEDPDVLVVIAACRNRLGQAKQARQLLDDVLAGHPHHGAALRTRGEVEMLAGSPDKAEDWLRRAAEEQPNDYLTQWTLYQCLQQQGKEDEAKAQLARTEDVKARRERLVEIQGRKMTERPHDPALQCELGKLLLGLGYEDLGERWLLSSLHESDDHYGPAHAALAGYYDTRAARAQQQGDAGQAAAYRDKAAAERDKVPPAADSAAPAGKNP
jgi:tetratricopeptide (TPR) repeat protein